MKIKAVKAYRRLLALKKPYTIARDTFYDAEIVFFEVELENGMRGMGAANTDVDVVGESADDTLTNLQSDAVMQLAGKDIRNFLPHIQLYREVFSKYPGTQAAIDMALHDAFCQCIGISVLDFYGRRHEKMLTSVTIGIKNVAETLEEAQEYYDGGFRALKVKTGREAELDAERIIKLREAYGAHFVIRVDANTGYDLSQLKTFIRLTDGQQVELIEQPFLPGMEDELLQLPMQTRAILAADESLKNTHSAFTLAQQKAFGIFNIKMMKCGGITSAFEIATIAAQAGISLFWGCNDESMVGITAALHAAFACPHTKYIDLDGSLDLMEDVAIKGFSIKDGYMMPNNLPGFGLTYL
ncbi:dipeptide epimerase [Mucilaginibacter sp. CSA2-8R]|uniref:mandelate racemase/muconate lactonizing enzyme family protein n=1 Tax=Mucilaginibacter sp. CSA2-8R TaxID=3141542 RepID=UPI00315D6465